MQFAPIGGRSKRFSDGVVSPEVNATAIGPDETLQLSLLLVGVRAAESSLLEPWPLGPTVVTAAANCSLDAEFPDPMAYREEGWIRK